jgi:Tol biopolymer transport system component
MSLAPGTRLGPYEILGPLGAGGMGEVYRARDSRLDRTVAVKILPDHLAADPAFRARFEREAKTVSALNHPHICTLHDIGEHQGVHYLVMEHLEGETLASRLNRGPLPVEEALPIAAQIASALALAHRHGVIHRDLKPGNIALTRDAAKLLDFGLAKQGPQAAPPISSAVMTEASPLTAQGTIVGTWQYMSPEQLEGMEADARSDIFSFGAVFYEMLTGRRAFEGRSQASLIAAIMGTQPAPLSAVLPGVSPELERIVRRCLANDPEDRWQSAADLASELKWITRSATPEIAAGTSVSGVAEPVAAVPAPARKAGRPLRRERILWAGLAVILAAVAGGLAARYYLAPSSPEHLVTTALMPPPKSSFDTRYPPAVSPDGKKVVFVVLKESSKPFLYLRNLDSDQVRLIPGTENAAFPFWAPDSRWIGFFTGDKLQKIDTEGGPAIPLCDAQDGRGGSWNRDGVILFQPRFSDPLYKVAAGGGKPERVTKLDDKLFHVAHRWPMFLPDGKSFLFYVVATTNPATSEHSGIYVGSLDSTEIRQLARIDSRMAYAQGHLLFKSGTTLMAQRFDPERFELSGDPLPLAAEVVGGAYSWGGAKFGVSDQGVLVYMAGAGQGETELVWFDRSGTRVGRLGDPDFYYDFRLSRDGRRAAICIGKDAGDVWLHDLDRDVRTRFTFDPSDDTAPVWSPDDRLLAFRSSRKEIGELYWRDTHGTGEEELLHSTGTQLLPSDWSPDGRILVFTSLSRDTGFDLWTWSVEEKKAEPWFAGPLDQANGRISPDGKRIAYSSAESGRMEIYVQTFPGKGGGRWQVSRSGGDLPVWRGDGKELFYLAPEGTLMAVDVSGGESFRVGTPRGLFRVAVKGVVGSSYDVTPDGQRFLVNSLKEGDRGGQSATVVLNWPEILRK